MAATALGILGACSLEDAQLGGTLVDGRVSVVAEAYADLQWISKVVVYGADSDGAYYDRDIAVFRLDPLRRRCRTVPLDGPSEAYRAEIRSPMNPSSFYAVEVIDQDGGYAGEVIFRPQDLREGRVLPGVGRDDEPIAAWLRTDGDCVGDGAAAAVGLSIIGLLLVGFVGSGVVIVKDARRRRHQRWAPPGVPPDGPKP